MNTHSANDPYHTHAHTRIDDHYHTRQLHLALSFSRMVFCLSSNKVDPFILYARCNWRQRLVIVPDLLKQL